MPKEACPALSTTQSNDYETFSFSNNPGPGYPDLHRSCPALLRQRDEDRRNHRPFDSGVGKIDGASGTQMGGIEVDWNGG